MYFKRETISPDRARELLARNIRNRRLNSKRVKMYSDDIKNGNWTESPFPICIDSEGNLIDGQHRLTAVVESGIPTIMTVAYNVPQDAVIDKGLERSTGDALYMRGLINKNMSSGRAVAIVNRYMAINGKEIISDTEKATFINTNEDKIEKAISISKTGTHQAICDKASIQTAILGALQHGVSESELRRFATVVNTGFMEQPSESAAIILRNYIFQTPISGATASNEVCAVTQMAIKDFISKTPRRSKYRKKLHIYIKE